MTTGTASADRCTSSSSKRTPRSSAEAKAGRVFSGYSRALPRWAISWNGPDWFKQASRSGADLQLPGAGIGCSPLLIEFSDGLAAGHRDIAVNGSAAGHRDL